MQTLRGSVPMMGLMFSLALTVSARGEDIVEIFDGADPSSGRGDVAWSLAERPAPDGGFLIVGEHLLDEAIDSHRRQAMLIVTDARGKPQRRIPLEGYTHATKIRSLGKGEYVIAGNKKGRGASVLFVDGEGNVLRERAHVIGDSKRSSAGLDAYPTPDGGYLVACIEGMDGFVTKLDADLNTVFASVAIKDMHYAKSAVQLANGECFMVGQHLGGKGIHLARWGAEGALLEERVLLPDPSVNKGRKILATKGGGLAVTGMLGSGGRGQFLFMELDPSNLAEPVTTVRVRLEESVSNYGQAMTQCRDGSFVIAGRSGQGDTHLLSLVRIDGDGKVIAGPRYFGSRDPDSGEAGYDVIECRDGSLAVVGMHGTALLGEGSITDVSPSTDFFFVKVRL